MRKLYYGLMGIGFGWLVVLLVYLIVLDKGPETLVAWLLLIFSVVAAGFAIDYSARMLRRTRRK